MEALPPTEALPPSTPPRVVFWFRIYTGCMTVVYLLCVLAAPLLYFASTRAHGEEAVMFKVQAAVLLAVGAVLAMVFALPFLLPRKPWVWIYDLVLICIGMTSCCILPAAIPLLIYWFKAEVKDWFNSV